MKRRLWNGYAPSINKSHRYKVTADHRIACQVTIGDLGEFPAVAAGKYPEILSQRPEGGSFRINEWKQLIVPAWQNTDTHGFFCENELPGHRFSFRLSPTPWLLQLLWRLGLRRCLRLRSALARLEVDNSRGDFQPGDRWELATVTDGGDHYPVFQEVGTPHKYDLHSQTLSRKLQSGPDSISMHSTLRVAFSKALGEGKPMGPPSGRFYVNEHGIIFLPGSAVARGFPVFVAKVDVDGGRWFDRFPNSGAP